MGSFSLKVLVSSWYSVSPDVTVTLQDVVHDEGLRAVVPFWQFPVILSTRVRPTTLKAKTGSKDLQTVDIALRVLFQPDVDNLPLLYQQYGRNYSEYLS